MTTIEERADAYVGHPFEIDEFSSTTAKRQAFIDGAKEQRKIDIDKACQWITEHIDIPYKGEFIDDEPVASDYIEWCEKRLECAKAIADAFRQTMEEQL